MYADAFLFFSICILRRRWIFPGGFASALDFSGWWEFRIYNLRRRWIPGSGLKVHFASSLDFPVGGFESVFYAGVGFSG